MLPNGLPQPLRHIQAIVEVRPGGPMTSEIPRMVVQSFRTPSVAPGMEGLRAREAETLELLAEGLSNKEITQKTNIVARIVRNHLANIFQQLYVRRRIDAATKYFRTK